MSTRAGTRTARVRSREQLSEHLIRLVLDLDGFESTGIADEWIGLVVPGQFQSRYYTVRSFDADSITIDIVVHSRGLVTEWAADDVVGQSVTITDAKGSYAAATDAAWIMLVGDLTAFPAMARIAESTDRPVRIWAEAPSIPPGYFPSSADVNHLPQGAQSRLSAIVEEISWPEGDGYFWMAGESAQMRSIRKFLMHDRAMPTSAYDVMGYWRQVKERQPRAVDPGPIWREGKRQGLTDAQIWDNYDKQRETAE
ncbi:siderophore-interacting protein [Nocardioides baekrokdamisoli]|uniref:Siderophore-interacting protein n=1 Tax=Nocardioides baekrokdamisoli TaxID=1804624 RepID=A0A3G9IBA3_9ACTN|nr:siderophore-interacting protein [Nocardioides baekrokdamisoli]BBH16080.1 siderophore-interacting protein [Nocardioides baekrokdamisoli]